MKIKQVLAAAMLMLVPFAGALAENEHEPITMMAAVPFRNPSALVDLVHEQYPEINIEFVPYSGYNLSAYMRAQFNSDNMPDIFSTSGAGTGLHNMGDRLMDLAGYGFTDNYNEAQLRDVTSEGAIYLLPMYYNALGIVYNKTLLEEHGWSLPTSFAELEALAPEVEAAGLKLALNMVQFPGYGLQYMFDILDTGYFNTIAGRKWQRDFLRGDATFEGTAGIMADMAQLQKWRDIGMLDADGDILNDTETRKRMAAGEALFLVGGSPDFTGIETEYEFGTMPYLSEDGRSNAYILNVSRYLGLNKHLQDEGNEQKLEDALHVMEIISTEAGMKALNAGYNHNGLLPLKGFVIEEDSLFKPIEAELNAGYTAPYIYSGWENLYGVVGEKMFEFMRGECDAAEVAAFIDENQHLIWNDDEMVYTTVTETLSVEDCVQAVGICFTQAAGADLALVSTNKWYDREGDSALNTRGVACGLYALPTTDEELTAMLPTGWTGDIQTVTFTGKRIRELLAEGYDKFGDGERIFPYHMVAPDGFELDDDTAYTVVICGATKDVLEEGDAQDTGILGLDAARAYFGAKETFGKADIRWEK